MDIRLRDKADQYEKDGEPGPLGYNCWGWRDIARHLREIAEEFEREEQSPTITIPVTFPKAANPKTLERLKKIAEILKT